MNATLEHALRYVFLGWRVLPLLSGSKEPAIKAWPTQATVDRTTLNQWFSGEPRNLGIATGAGSGLLILDVDPRHGGDETLAKLVDTHGPVPDTVECLTPSGGRHIYFRYPRNVEIRNSAGRLGPGLDIRAEGGYVVAPPSTLNGRAWEWEGSSDPLEGHKVAEVPEWLIALLTDRKASKGATGEGRIPEGRRNNHLASLAGSMRRRAMSQAAIEAALLTENAERCDPPLPEDEVRRIVDSVARYEPSGGEPPSQAGEDPPPYLNGNPPVEAYEEDARSWQDSERYGPAGASTERKPESRDESTSFELTRLSDLLAELDEDTEFVVDGLLPKSGFSVLVAKPKVGKSTLARNIALGVAQGKPVLGKAVTQGGVIYLALEDKRAEVRRSFKAMGATGDENIWIYAATAPVDALERLRKAIEEKTPVLVIIDPLFRFTRVADTNDYARVTAALEPLLALARTTGAHVLCCHHAPKGERQGGDAILGSTAIFGAVDTAIFLKRTCEHRIIYTHQRYGEDMEETILSFNRDSRLVSLGATREEEAIEKASDAILEQLKKNEAMTEAQICEESEGMNFHIRKALRDLLQAGKVIRSGEGKKNNPYLYSKKDGKEEDPPTNNTEERIQPSGERVPEAPENSFLKMAEEGIQPSGKQAPEDFPILSSNIYKEERKGNISPHEKLHQDLPNSFLKNPANLAGLENVGGKEWGKEKVCPHCSGVGCQWCVGEEV